MSWRTVATEAKELKGKRREDSKARYPEDRERILTGDDVFPQTGGRPGPSQILG
jgi:hypothetical protein